MSRFVSCALLLCVALLCAWLMAGCGSESSKHFPPGVVPYRIYTNDDYGFSILFPKAWSLDYNNNGLTVQATSPLENATDTFGESSGVIGVYMDYDRTLEDFHLRNKGALATIYNSYNFQFKGEGDTKINGRDAKVLEFTYTSDGTTYYNQEFEVVCWDRAYVVLNVSTPDDVSRFRDLFAEIGHSLSISYDGSDEDLQSPESHRVSAEASPTVRAALAAGSGAKLPSK